MSETDLHFDLLSSQIDSLTSDIEADIVRHRISPDLLISRSLAQNGAPDLEEPLVSARIRELRRFQRRLRHSISTLDYILDPSPLLEITNRTQSAEDLSEPALQPAQAPAPTTAASDEDDDFSVITPETSTEQPEPAFQAEPITNDQHFHPSEPAANSTQQEADQRGDETPLPNLDRSSSPPPYSYSPPHPTPAVRTLPPVNAVNHSILADILSEELITAGVFNRPNRNRSYARPGAIGQTGDFEDNYIRNRNLRRPRPEHCRTDVEFNSKFAFRDAQYRHASIHHLLYLHGAVVIPPSANDYEITGRRKFHRGPYIPDIRINLPTSQCGRCSGYYSRDCTVHQTANPDSLLALRLRFHRIAHLLRIICSQNSDIAIWFSIIIVILALWQSFRGH